MLYCIGAGNSSITTTGPYNCTACKVDHIQVKLYNGYIDGAVECDKSSSRVLVSS